MSWNICSYQDCMVQRKPCSSIAFFRLPHDEPRRTKWIMNSGNRQLRKLTSTQVRFFCEMHFQQMDIKQQFNRKLLRKHAVPMRHESLPEEDGVETEQIHRNKEVEEADQAEANDAEALEEKQLELKSEETVAAVEDQHEMESSQSERLSEEDDAYMMEYTVEFDATDEISPVADSEAQLSDLPEPNLRSPTTITPTPTHAPIGDHNAVAGNEKAITSSNAVVGAEDESYLSDKHYALSLVYYFQRLSAEKKARAKIKILAYLSALELGEETDLSSINQNWC